MTKRISRWLQMLTALAFTAAAMAATEAEHARQNEFFAPGFDSGEELPAEQIYPRGRIFPFSGFAPSDIAAAKQAGFTMAGPVYSAYQERKLLEGCEKENLFLILPIHPEANGEKLTKKLLDQPQPDFTPYWEDIAAKVRKAAENPRLAWWYLTPEELRPWRANDMAFLKGALKAIRENDPQKRPVWLYLPNHYTREQMRVFGETLDIVGKGMYPTQLGKENDRVWCRWSTENETGAILDAESDATPICVPEMFRQPSEEQLADLEKIVRHDVYLSLVSGAKGVVVFSLAERPGFTAHKRYFDAYAAVASELTGERKLGELFLFGKRMDALKIRTLSGPVTLAVDTGINNKRDPREYPAVATAEIGYRDTRALFLVNSAKGGSVKLQIEGLPAEKTEIIDLFSGQTVTSTETGSFETELAPYEVKAFQFIGK